MRPTIVVNPGPTAYQAPRPDPLLARTPNLVNSRAGPFVAAKQQTDWQTDGRAAFAAAQKFPPEAVRKKRGQVRARAHARRSPLPLHSAPLALRAGIESE